MEMIKYTNFKVDEHLFGKGEIIGLYDKSGEYLNNTLYDIKSAIEAPHIPCGLYLKFKSKNQKLTATLMSEFGIDRELQKRTTKKLSSTEAIKISLINVLSSDAKTVILDSIDAYFNTEDFCHIIKTIKSHLKELDKTIIFLSNKPDHIIKADRYIVANESSIIYSGKDLHKLPIKTETMLFADLANKKGAKLDYYKEANDLLKAIYRNVR